MPAPETRAILPADHPQRFALHNEVHARPHEALQAPTRLSMLALLVDADQRGREHAHVAELCRRCGVHPPAEDAIHFSSDMGVFRLRWERHSEFTTYAFLRAGASAQPFAEPAILSVPQDWLGATPGQTVFAAHAELLADAEHGASPEKAAAHFGGNALIGAEIAGDAALALTDFRVHADGFGRILVYGRQLTPALAGRLMQRLLEIETYRMMALLALPLARAAAPRVASMERELAQISATIAGERSADEPTLLDQLTRLAVAVENAVAEGRFRFAAARAYHDLVLSRIAELREQRVSGMQTIGEFMARRLAPAMATCESVARRQLELSGRVERASSLLRTRVDIVREKQNQQLLASMDRRARLQLRLQETVEGLSVAAITYYVVGLVGYAARGIAALGADVPIDIVTAASIPLVAVLVALGVRQIRRSVIRGSQG